MHYVLPSNTISSRILPIPFALLTICGFWRPPSFTSSLAKLLYDCYSFVMTVLIYMFTLSHLIDVALTSKNFDTLTGSCFMLLSMMNVCCKITNLLYFRKSILELVGILENGHCVARDAAEKGIQSKYHKRSRFVSVCYLSLTEMTCLLITARTFFLTPKRILPFKAWIPYNLNSSLSYWLTFCHQTIAHVGAANVQIANETLICGLLMQASSQLEILKHRFAKVPEDFGDDRQVAGDRKENLVDCVLHHRRVIEFSRKLNVTFNIIIFFQFVVSSLVLCSSVYLLSKMNLLSVQFMSLTLYLSCMLYQIFLFCWYGNELILQSSDLVNAIYHMDWTNLNIKNKKDLLRTMLLVRKPIKFTSSFLINLSIDSYCKILKASYSVFNLLQRTSM